MGKAQNGLPSVARQWGKIYSVKASTTGTNTKIPLVISANPLFATAISDRMDDNVVIHITKLEYGQITVSMDLIPDSTGVLNALWVAICSS